MKNKKTLLVVWSLVVIGCVIAGVKIIGSSVAKQKTQQPSQIVPAPASRLFAVQPPAAKIPRSAANDPITSPAQTETATDAQAQLAQSQAGQSQGGQQEIQDPAAREALAFVGDNPDADEYWAAAINNPDIPADERRELIEDLNQDGFADPKNLGTEDLPLIVNRLRLIEDLAPYAMDDINADAFLEAYKDLVKMYVRVTQR